MINTTLYLLFYMEAGFNLLPKRGSNSSAKEMANTNKEIFLTNYYEINLSHKNSTVYQYSFDTEPQIPADSIQLLNKTIAHIKKSLKQKIGFTSSSGNMIWGSKSINISATFTSEFKIDETPYKFQVTVKPAKQLDLFDLQSKPEYRERVFQVLNTKIKEKLKKFDMVDLGGGKYYDNEASKQGTEFSVEGSGLKVLRGFKFTLCNIKNQTALQIDVCSRVIRKQSLLETISQMNKNAVQGLIGSIVLTRYGKRRTYVIQDVDFSKNPNSEFYHEKRAGKISYANYYKENYEIKIRDTKQPLIKSVSRIQKKLENGKLVENPVYCYLIPELVGLTGMSDQERANFQTMKALAPYTKLTPKQRLVETDKLKDQLNKDDEMIGNPKKMNGFVYRDPQVILKNNRIKIQGGNLNLRDKIKEPIVFKDWIFVYSLGNQPKYDDQDADQAIQTMKKAQGAFGITMKDPGFLTIEGKKINDWISAIQNDVKNNGKPQIVVLFVQKYQEKLYGELKDYLTNTLKVPSQFIRRNTLLKAKNPMSAASKIIIQMNVKVGGAPWQVVKKHKYFDNKKIMCGGISISKGKKGFTIGFVGTTTNDETKVYNYCKVGIPRKEDISKAVFEQFFVGWAKAFFMNSKEVPTTIIVYREGLSIQQIKSQIGTELEALNSMVKKIAQKTNNPKYKPEINYVVVNKKTSSRFYALNDSSSNQSGGKFRPNVNNPDPGSVILQEMSVDNIYDFHLTAQMVTQGSANLTQYIVAYDTSTMPQDALTQHTYEQCYGYYNWMGSVKVPACLQYANKLSKLVGQSIKKDVIQGQMQKTYYFL